LGGGRPPAISYFTPTLHTPAHDAHDAHAHTLRKVEASLSSEGIVCRRVQRVQAPARAPCAPETLAAARVLRCPYAGWAQRPTTARAHRQLPRCRCAIAHTAHTHAHGVRADLLAREQDCAAACTPPQPESCSPAAKCMRARARNARCSPSLS
jgi:hypothetical protein